MIKDFYNANTAEPGDVFVCVVTCHIEVDGYRLYRCAWPPLLGSDDTPQGDGMYDTDEVIKQLFPIVGWLDIPERR